MNALGMYLFQVNIGLVLFYLFYRLLFAGDTFWKTRRVYLLLSFVVSFLYPLLSIESWLTRPEPVQSALLRISTLPEINVMPQESSSFFLSDLMPETILAGIYMLIVMVLLIRLMMQLIAILRFRMKGNLIELFGIQVVDIDESITPFSFFGRIYLNPRMHSDMEIKQILVHELTHVQQKHSLDVLMTEFICILFWYNPAVWLLKRDIRQNLEFLADNKVLQSGVDSRTYQYHLLQLSYQSPEVKIGNNFNISPIKKRIIMMNKKNSNKTALLKYALIVPLVLALIVVANAQDIVKKAKKSLPPVTEIKVDEAKADVKQDVKTEIKSVDEIVPEVQELKEEKIYEMPEKMPEYPGGSNALMTFLAQNVRYPVAAQEAGVQGKIFVKFVVDKAGAILNPVVIMSEIKGDETPKAESKDAEIQVIGYAKKDEKAEQDRVAGMKALEKEAIRVVSALANFIPGEDKGEKVSVYYVLPLNFRLQ